MVSAAYGCLKKLIELSTSERRLQIFERSAIPGRSNTHLTIQWHEERKMAGDLFIETLSYDDLERIQRCGGILQASVFHADQDSEQNFAILNTRLSEAQQNRKHLPPHCYIEFNKNSIDLKNMLVLSSLLDRTSCPAGIVKIRQAFANWAALDGGEKAVCLHGVIQNGSITLEFYKVGLWRVKTHFKDFAMINE